MKWQILKFIYEGKTIFKLLRGFSGGYLHGDSWMLNSGITKIECDVQNGHNVYVVSGVSGSKYSVYPDDEGMIMIMAGQYNFWKEQHKGIAEISLSSVKEFQDAQD